MHNPPRLPYNGVTVIMSNPSRFDLATRRPDGNGTLLSGYCGTAFNDMLAPVTTRYACDIVTLEDWKGVLLPGTKVILALGEGCLRRFYPNLNRTISQQRGSPLELLGTPVIPSFFPQDTLDMQDWEGKYNPLSTSTGTYDTEEDEEAEDIKNMGGTKKTNWRFWLALDVAKALRIRDSHELLSSNPAFSVECYPSVDRVTDYLRQDSEHLYLDIETDAALNITCFSVSHGSDRHCLVVPFIRYTYKHCYGPLQTAQILRGLAGAMVKCEVVVHNAMFDLLVLALRYKIPVGRRVYDTMVACHRTHPHAEKSLGHGMSAHTYLPYHKDEGVFAPQNESDELKLWYYNAKDVYGMYWLRKGIERLASSIKGLPESIAQANDSIQPYLINTLLGIAFDEQRRSSMCSLYARQMMQYLRCMGLLLGPEIVKPIAARSNKGFIMSNNQCAMYFHQVMKWPVKKRTEKGVPSVDEGVIQKLRLEHPDNKVLDLILRYRAKKKAIGTLNFTPTATQPQFREITQ